MNHTIVVYSRDVEGVGVVNSSKKPVTIFLDKVKLSPNKLSD